MVSPFLDRDRLQYQAYGPHHEFDEKTTERWAKILKI
jgi:hypothetical protein